MRETGQAIVRQGRIQGDRASQRETGQEGGIARGRVGEGHKRQIECPMLIIYYNVFPVC